MMPQQTTAPTGPPQTNVAHTQVCATADTINEGYEHVAPADMVGAAAADELYTAPTPESLHRHVTEVWASYSMPFSFQRNKQTVSGHLLPGQGFAGWVCDPKKVAPALLVNFELQVRAAMAYESKLWLRQRRQEDMPTVAEYKDLPADRGLAAADRLALPGGRHILRPYNNVPGLYRSQYGMTTPQGTTLPYEHGDMLAKTWAEKFSNHEFTETPGAPDIKFGFPASPDETPDFTVWDVVTGKAVGLIHIPWLTYAFSSVETIMEDPAPTTWEAIRRSIIEKTKNSGRRHIFVAWSPLPAEPRAADYMHNEPSPALYRLAYDQTDSLQPLGPRGAAALEALIS